MTHEIRIKKNKTQGKAKFLSVLVHKKKKTTKSHLNKKRSLITLLKHSF